MFVDPSSIVSQCLAFSKDFILPAYEESLRIIRCSSDKNIFSICVTVLVLNIHFRTPETHKMAPWVRKVFIHILPRLLNIKRPYFDKDKHR